MTSTLAVGAICNDLVMAFGQNSGPPAPSKQIEEILELLETVGFSGFREARHPYGLTQRQAGGKFSRAEADSLLERLQAEVEGQSRVDGEPSLFTRVPDRQLAAELQRRGWVVMEP